MDDKDSQNSNSKFSLNNPVMQQSMLEHPSVFHCPFCGFPASIGGAMQDHLILHFQKSVHQCQRCVRNFKISSAPEFYLYLQTKDRYNLKENNRPTGGDNIRMRSATVKSEKCEYVAELKQDLEVIEIQHEEKYLRQCRLCSSSVEECTHLTRHKKDNHPALQNNPAPIQEIRVESDRLLMVRTDGIVLQQVRVEPMTAPSEEQARTEPITLTTQEVILQEVRTGPTVPPTENVPPLSETKKKWRVESLQAPKDGSYRISNSAMVVTSSKSARPRLAQRSTPAFKTFQRRKQHGLVLWQVLTAMRKMDQFKKKKSKPQESDVAVPVPAALSPLLNTQEKEELNKTQEVVIAAPERLENKAADESTGANEQLLEAHENDEEEVEYKCTGCNYSTLCWDSIKSHSKSFHRAPPSEVYNKIKMESNAISQEVVDILEEEPIESTRCKKKGPKTRKGRKFVFECSDCEFSTIYWTTMKRHKENHNQMEKFKCEHCSFSARMRAQVTYHSNRYHCNPPSVPLEVKEVKKERKFKEEPSP